MSNKFGNNISGTKNIHINMDIFRGGDLHTVLELFETITTHYETIFKWNSDMKEFLAQERKESAFDFTL